MQILSGKVIITIVIIIFPLCYMIASIITNFSIVPLRTELYPIGDLSIGLPSVPLTLTLLVFAFILAIYSTPKSVKKNDYENVIKEYQYLKKILYISTFTFITFFLQAIVIPLYYQYILKTDISEYPIGYTINTMYYLSYMILPVSMSIIIKLLLEHARKEFQLYYAKGCFKIVSKEDTSQLDKAKYFKIGLIWYNKFLKRNTGLHINDITKIYSKIITDSSLDQNSELITISESFNSEDGLKPLRYLSAVIPKEAGQALTQQSIRSTIEESSDLLIPIITVIITIITSFIFKIK